MAKEEKVTYLCADGHTTMQWEDKNPPKRCSAWRAGKGCPNTPFDPESKQAEAQMVQMVADADIPNKSETAAISGRPVQKKAPTKVVKRPSIKKTIVKRKTK